MRLMAGIGGTDCLYLLQILENQVEVRQREVVELQSQVKALSQEVKDTDEVDGRRKLLEKKFQELLEPLQWRRNLLLASREVHQFNRDVEDEIVSTAAEVASDDIAADDVIMMPLTGGCFSVYGLLASVVEHFVQKALRICF